MALEYAKKYPENVSHVVMIGIAPSLSPIHAAAAEQYWQDLCFSRTKSSAYEEAVHEFCQMLN